MRHLPRAAMLILLILTGCGTMGTRSGGKPNPWGIYPATRMDIGMVWYGVTGRSILSDGNGGSKLIGCTVLPLCFLADIPVSMVTDTVMIYPDLRAQNEAEQSLTFVVAEGSVRKARKLLEQGADPDGESNRCPPLVTACGADNMEMVRLLVEHGADVNLKRKEDGHWGNTPLIAAIDLRNIQIAKYLIQHGADVNITDGRGTPLMYASKTIQYAGPPPAIQLMQLLVENGANVNVVCPGEGTVLDSAIKAEEELGAMIKYLPTENGCFIGYKEIYSSHKELISYLRAHGAKRAAELKATSK